MKNIEFGVRPILMMRYNGSLRIIMPDGRVEYCPTDDSEFFRGCTSAASQEAAYRLCIYLDENNFKYFSKYPCLPRFYTDQNYSAFLGYL